MLLQAAKNGARTSPFPITRRIVSVDALPYPSESFDTVADTFGLCSWDDPVRGLKECFRVLKPGGTMLLLEHGRVPSPSALAFNSSANQSQSSGNPQVKTGDDQETGFSGWLNSALDKTALDHGNPPSLPTSLN